MTLTVTYKTCTASNQLTPGLCVCVPASAPSHCTSGSPEIRGLWNLGTTGCLQLLAQTQGKGKKKKKPRVGRTASRQTAHAANGNSPQKAWRLHQNAFRGSSAAPLRGLHLPLQERGASPHLPLPSTPSAPASAFSPQPRSSRQGLSVQKRRRVLRAEGQGLPTVRRSVSS